MNYKKMLVKLLAVSLSVLSFCSTASAAGFTSGGGSSGNSGASQSSSAGDNHGIQKVYLNDKQVNFKGNEGTVNMDIGETAAITIIVGAYANIQVPMLSNPNILQVSSNSATYGKSMPVGVVAVRAYQEGTAKMKIMAGSSEKILKFTVSNNVTTQKSGSSRFNLSRSYNGWNTSITVTLNKFLKKSQVTSEYHDDKGNYWNKGDSYSYINHEPIIALNYKKELVVKQGKTVKLTASMRDSRRANITFKAVGSNKNNITVTNYGCSNNQYVNSVSTMIKGKKPCVARVHICWQPQGQARCNIANVDVKVVR